MKSDALTFSVVFLLLPVLTGQTVQTEPPDPLIVPAGWAAKTGVWGGSFLTQPGQHPIRVQVGWDAADFSQAVAQLKSMEFRHFGQPYYSAKETNLQMTVSLSMGPTRPLNFTTVFAANSGAGLRSVFSGSIRWPSFSASGRTVPKFDVRIPFSTPFLFDSAKGRSLVFDSVVTSATGQGWGYDSAIRDFGKIVDSNPPWPGSINNECKDSRGAGVSLKRLRIAMYPGGQFNTAYLGGLPGASASMAIGVSGAGATWNGSRLPIDLAPLGAPKCFWAVAPLVFLPFRFDALGRGQAPIVPIPSLKAVIGLRFFEQAMIVDPKANSLGITVTGSTEYEIGSGAQPSVATVVAFNDKNGGKTGWWKLDQGPVVRFDY